MTEGGGFEYRFAVWGPARPEAEVLAALNDAGRDGWEVVGLAPRGVDVPMPGMGALAIPEVVFVLKRRIA